MKSFESIHIIPPLHRTTVNFVGMLPRDRYLSVKKKRNTFLALDKNSKITRWNSLSGKIEAQNSVSQDFTKFEVFGTEHRKEAEPSYLREWNAPRSLLVSKADVPAEEADEFGQSLRISNQIKGAKPLQATELNKVKFKLFKLVQIKDESSVEELLSFAHPYYKDKQRLHFSQDCTVMVEKIVNLKIVVYRWQGGRWV